MSASEHERAAADIVAHCALVTLSDTRQPGQDESGDTAARMLGEAGHSVVDRALIPDDVLELGAILDRWAHRDDVDCIITIGGTGISGRDQTIAVVRERLAVELPGFGEIFRHLSYQQVGPPAMLSRAMGGITGPPSRSALFALPGSRKAVELGISQLIAPILRHLLREVRRDREHA